MQYGTTTLQIWHRRVLHTNRDIFLQIMLCRSNTRWRSLQCCQLDCYSLEITTYWNSEKCTVCRNLRIGEFRSPKMSFLRFLLFQGCVLNFTNLVNFGFKKCQNSNKSIFQSLEMCQNGRFCTWIIPKIDFT